MKAFQSGQLGIRFLAVIAFMMPGVSPLYALNICLNDRILSNSQAQQEFYKKELAYDALHLNDGDVDHLNRLESSAPPVDPRCKQISQPQIDQLVVKIKKSTRPDDLVPSLSLLREAVACGYTLNSQGLSLMDTIRAEAGRFGKHPCVLFWLTQTACVANTLQMVSSEKLPELSRGTLLSAHRWPDGCQTMEAVPETERNTTGKKTDAQTGSGVAQ